MFKQQYKKFISILMITLLVFNSTMLYASDNSNKLPKSIEIVTDNEEFRVAKSENENAITIATYNKVSYSTR